MKSSAVPVAYRALWLLLALAMAVAFTVWATRINAAFTTPPGAASTPVPIATVAPHIATLYSNIGPPDPAALCAEISPTPHEITVESTTGVVIATVQCTS